MRNWITAFLVVVGLCALVMTHDPPMRHSQAQETGSVLIGNGWNLGALSSGSAVFGTDLKTTRAGSVIRIGVALGTSVPLGIRETDGTNTFTEWLNSGTALVAGCTYTFAWEARNSKALGGVTGPTSFNFVVGGNTSVPILRVTECVGGVD